MGAPWIAWCINSGLSVWDGSGWILVMPPVGIWCAGCDIRKNPFKKVSMVQRFYIKASENRQILSKCKVTKWEMFVLEDMGISRLAQDPEIQF